MHPKRPLIAALARLCLPLNMHESTILKHFAATFSLKPGTVAAGAAAADPPDGQHVSGHRGQGATRTTGGLPADPRSEAAPPRRVIYPAVRKPLEFFNHTHDCLKVMAPQTRAPVYEYPALIAEWLRHFLRYRPSPRLHLAHHHSPPPIPFPLHLSADSIEQSRLSPPAGLHNFHRLDSFKTVESPRIATACGYVAESADGPGVTRKMDGAFKLDGARGAQPGGSSRHVEIAAPRPLCSLLKVERSKGKVNRKE